VPGVEITGGGRPGTPFGCLGSVLAVLLLIVFVTAIAVGAVVLLVVVGALLAVGLVALAVDRILLALSPGRRQRRDAMRSGGMVIDTTARVERSGDDPTPGGGELPGPGDEPAGGSPE
jgi:hypothetical protein